MESTDAELAARVVEAAESVDSELGAEGVRTLDEEERRQLVWVAEELELLSLAIIYDEPH